MEKERISTKLLMRTFLCIYIVWGEGRGDVCKRAKRRAERRAETYKIREQNSRKGDVREKQREKTKF